MSDNDLRATNAPSPAAAVKAQRIRRAALPQFAGKAKSSQGGNSAAPVGIARPYDACAYLGICRSTLYRLIGEGKLKPVKIGARAVGFTYVQLDAYIASATAA